MRLPKFKVITASIVLLLGSQSGSLLAEDKAASQKPAEEKAAEATTQAPAATTQAPTATQAPRAMPVPPRAYRGYRGYGGHRGYRPHHYRGRYRDWDTPFGSSGPRFSGPWDNDGKGFGFGSPSFSTGRSGPSFGTSRGPGFRSRSWDDDWGRDRFYDDRFGDSFYDDPYYDRGSRYRGSRYRKRGPRFYDGSGSGSGMGFNW